MLISFDGLWKVVVNGLCNGTAAEKREKACGLPVRCREDE
jgi:hypothetical protein